LWISKVTIEKKRESRASGREPAASSWVKKGLTRLVDNGGTGQELPYTSHLTDWANNQRLKRAGPYPGREESATIERGRSVASKAGSGWCTVSGRGEISVRKRAKCGPREELSCKRRRGSRGWNVKRDRRARKGEKSKILGRISGVLVIGRGGDIQRGRERHPSGLPAAVDKDVDSVPMD